MYFFHLCFSYLQWIHSHILWIQIRIYAGSLVIRNHSVHMLSLLNCFVNFIFFAKTCVKPQIPITQQYIQTITFRKNENENKQQTQRKKMFLEKCAYLWLIWVHQNKVLDSKLPRWKLETKKPDKIICICFGWN